METKRCTHCGEFKPLDLFYRHPTGWYRARCRQCESAASSVYGKAHREQRRVVEQAYRDRNSDARNARERERYAQGSRVAHRERVARWRAANSELYLVAARRYASKRRALKKGGDADGAAFIDVLLDDPCSYCGQSAESVDHIEPLIRGGANDWTNLTAACLSCNASKRERPLLVWLATRP